MFHTVTNTGKIPTRKLVNNCTEAPNMGINLVNKLSLKLITNN